MRVLRIYHDGRDPRNLAREHALAAAGVELTVVVPTEWPHPRERPTSGPEAFRVVEIPVRRPGNVNRHDPRDRAAMAQVLADTRPDVVDIHEEPVSVAARRWREVVPDEVPVVMYTAQNIDKRYPPPFAQYERASLRRTAAFYPCSSQAAAVLRSKGFAGTIEVLPLGYDDATFRPGDQSLGNEIVLMFVGRFVAEKGGEDALRVLARVNELRPARLLMSGMGPDRARLHGLASSLGVSDRVAFRGWEPDGHIATGYRDAHFALVPSRPTDRWAEQFGRVIVEAQASGAVVVCYESGAIAGIAGEAALAVPPGDVDQMAAAVARVIADPEDFERRRRAGWAQVAPLRWSAVAPRQVALYERALGGSDPRLTPERSPRRRRAAARAEFGPTASTPAGDRPFALPLLRRGGALARAFAYMIDGTLELAARLRS